MHLNNGNGQSYIWYTQRKRWNKGPNLFEPIDGPWACTGINATTAIFVTNPAPLRAYVYDFEGEQIIDYPFLPKSVVEVPHHYPFEFTLAILVTKQQRK